MDSWNNSPLTITRSPTVIVPTYTTRWIHLYYRLSHPVLTTCLPTSLSSQTPHDESISTDWAIPYWLPAYPHHSAVKHHTMNPSPPTQPSRTDYLSIDITQQSNTTRWIHLHRLSHPTLTDYLPTHITQQSNTTRWIHHYRFSHLVLTTCLPTSLSSQTPHDESISTDSAIPYWLPVYRHHSAVTFAPMHNTVTWSKHNMTAADRITEWTVTQTTSHTHTVTATNPQLC